MNHGHRVKIYAEKTWELSDDSIAKRCELVHDVRESTCQDFFFDLIEEKALTYEFGLPVERLTGYRVLTVRWLTKKYLDGDKP